MFTFPVRQVQCQNHLPELSFWNFYLPRAGLNVEPCWYNSYENVDELFPAMVGVLREIQGNAQELFSRISQDKTKHLHLISDMKEENVFLH